MKSTFLILSVVALFNFAAVAQELNYSLWPKRPPEIEQARRLISEQKTDEAVALLRQYVREVGIVGREARKLTGAVNVRKYLSRLHPDAKIYQVVAGDTLMKIASKSSCSPELVILLNGLVDPSALKAGQKLVVAEMHLSAEISIAERELTVWHGEELVATYDVDVSGLQMRTDNVETKVEGRDGYIEGGILPRHSTQFLSAQRVIRLANGVSLTGAQAIAGAVVKMQAADVNELALLLSVGAEVRIIYSGRE